MRPVLKVQLNERAADPLQPMDMHLIAGVHYVVQNRVLPIGEVGPLAACCNELPFVGGDQRFRAKQPHNPGVSTSAPEVVRGRHAKHTLRRDAIWRKREAGCGSRHPRQQ